MRGKIVIIFLIMTFLLASNLVNAIEINSESSTTNQTNSKLVNGINPLGIGGWHDEVSMSQDGDELTNIYKTGNGGWEYPYDGNCLHMWAQEVNGDPVTTTAEYTFNISEGPVKYVTYYVNYKDVGVFSDGPDAKIWKWNGNWDVVDNIGDHHWSYDWEQHTFNTNSDLYVNEYGQIRTAANAWDDGGWPHMDDFSVKKMKIAYKAADEEIFLADYEGYDSDDDGSDDTVNISIDADVADFQDGTTVDVTANCKLIDPDGTTVDETNITWTIVDHQVEYGNTTLCSLGGINGDYTVNIILYDQFGNSESTDSTTLFLEPDPQRTITFYTDPSDVGSIVFDGATYNNGDTTMVSDGTYDISAFPDEYYAFENWTETGGLSVADPSSNETQITVSGDGTVTANFYFTLATVFFFIEPEDSGWIEIEGYVFENGTGVYIDIGTWNISAEKAQPEYYFAYWETVGNITMEDYYGQTTTVTINGDGYIIAYFVLNEPPNKPFRPYGPLTGEINVEHTYTTSATDPNEGDVYFMWDWGDGSTSQWLGPYASGEECEASHSWAGPRDYQIKVKAKDIYGAESDWSEPLTVTMYGRPSAPKISGPANGKPGTSYEYTFSSTDPDGEDLYFYIDWGDNTLEEWVGPYNSGEDVKISHSWNQEKLYTIRAMAKDTSEVVSDWSTMNVNMPRNRAIHDIFTILIEKFPILRILLNFL